MGVELTAWRVLAAIAYSAITILAWECIKAVTLQHQVDCDGDASCVWRRASQLLAQPGVPKASGNASLVDSIYAEAGGAENGTSAPAARMCLVRVFEHGTQPHERNVHSQHGEDGILDHIWECIAPENRTYVEIGVTDGSQCSTRQLREQGWAGLLLGNGTASHTINLHTASPTGDNIVNLLEQHSAPRSLGLLAIHINLHTFWALHAALQGGYQPRVIAAEFNGNFHPADALVAPHTPNKHWDGSTVFGATAGAFDILFQQLGYSTVAINQAQDTIFAVSKAVTGQERLLTMDQITAGVTAAPLCQAAHTCSGDSKWLEVTDEASVMMRLSRQDWYPMLPPWAVRCAAIARPGGGGSLVQWGARGAAEWLPSFAPGVVALLPCLPVGEATALGTAMVAAQSGPPNNGTAEHSTAAIEVNETDCRRPETHKSVERKRECLLSTFQGGTSGYETRRYSQFGEDGIIDAIFGCILTRDKYYVEFGVESGEECTTHHLREDGWTGLLMDGGNYRPEINLQQEFFNAEGIAYQFRKHTVPLRFDHLTIDIDQNTFWVLQAVLRAGYRPRVIVAEINRNFHPTDAFVVPYIHDKIWDLSGDFGASPGAYDALFAAFGYHTLAIDQDQINMYAVQSCEVGAERLFSMGEVTQGLKHWGPCLGVHGCNNGEHLQVTEEVAGLLTRPRPDWYGLMPRWWMVCSEPAPQNPARIVRILTGVPINGTDSAVDVPRFPPGAVTVEACAPVAEATAAALALAAAAPAASTAPAA